MTKDKAIQTLYRWKEYQLLVVVLSSKCSVNGNLYHTVRFICGNALSDNLNVAMATILGKKARLLKNGGVRLSDTYLINGAYFLKEALREVSIDRAITVNK